MNLDEGLRREIAARVLKYISANPFQGGPAEELLRWWQGLEGVHGSVDAVTEVIEELVREEKIEKVDLEEDLFSYRIKKTPSGG
jgi:hypothetical protein